MKKSKKRSLENEAKKQESFARRSTAMVNKLKSGEPIMSKYQYVISLDGKAIIGRIRTTKPRNISEPVWAKMLQGRKAEMQREYQKRKNHGEIKMTHVAENDLLFGNTECIEDKTPNVADKIAEAAGVKGLEDFEIQKIEETEGVNVEP